MRLSVTVGGSSRAPLIEGSSLSFGVGKIAEATLRFYSESPTDYDVLDAVTVVDPSGPTTYFTGYVVSLKVSRDGRLPVGKYFVEARCVGKEWLLSHPIGLVSAVYQNASDQDIILAALTAGGLTGDITASTSTIDSISTGLDVAYSRRTPKEVIDDMVQASGGIAYMDLSTLYYNAEGDAGAAAWDVNMDSPDGSTSYKVSGLEIEHHWERPATHVFVLGIYDGSTQVAAFQNAASFPRIFASIYESDQILTNAMASDVASAIVATRGAPAVSASFKFHDHDRSPLKANTLIDVTSSDHGLSAETMLIRSVGMRQVRDDVTEFTVSAGGIKPREEALLRRIEAGSKRRQQNLPKLVRGVDFTSSSSQAVNSGTSIANIDDLSSFTIFATIRPDTISGTQTICAKDDGSNKGWKLTMGTSVFTLTRTKTITGYTYSRLHGMTAGSVYRLVVTSSSSSGVRYWLNGVELTSGGGGNLGSGTLDSEASSPFRIARSNAGNYWNGFIGGIVLYDIALPETTAAMLHNASLTALPFLGNAQLIWVLDEFDVSSSVTGTDAIRDRSVNNYHGTPANTPVGDSVVFATT